MDALIIVLIGLLALFIILDSVNLVKNKGNKTTANIIKNYVKILQTMIIVILLLLTIISIFYSSSNLWIDASLKFISIFFFIEMIYDVTNEASKNRYVQKVLQKGNSIEFVFSTAFELEKILKENIDKNGDFIISNDDYLIINFESEIQYYRYLSDDVKNCIGYIVGQLYDKAKFISPENISSTKLYYIDKDIYNKLKYSLVPNMEILPREELFLIHNKYLLYIGAIYSYILMSIIVGIILNATTIPTWLLVFLVALGSYFLLGVIFIIYTIVSAIIKHFKVISNESKIKNIKGQNKQH